MNYINKLYCRAFQFVFRVAVPILPYRSPKLCDSISKVPLTLREKKISRVLIVTDKTVITLPAFNEFERHLKIGKTEYVIYDKTVPNPTCQNVEEAMNLYIKSDCKGLIAFGGGSCIDCAKAVGARISRKGLPISKMEGILKVIKPIPFLVAIPTTAGTGSEGTVTTVITDENTHHKFTASDFPLIPNVAVHDAALLSTLPPHIAATTGMDALTHAVEAYIGGTTTRDSEKNAIFALQLIFENIYSIYKNPADKTAASNMLYASYLAGKAFSKSYVGYCHAVAHTLGGEYNIPHGLANAVLLPYVLQEYGSSCHKKLHKLAVATNLCSKDTPKNKAAEIFILKIKEMNMKMGIPQKLSGIKAEDISRLATYAHKEANPLYPVPKLMNAKELEKLYYIVMEE